MCTWYKFYTTEGRIENTGRAAEFFKLCPEILTCDLERQHTLNQQTDKTSETGTFLKVSASKCALNALNHGIMSQNVRTKFLKIRQSIFKLPFSCFLRSAQPASFRSRTLKVVDMAERGLFISPPGCGNPFTQDAYSIIIVLYCAVMCRSLTGTP